VNRKQIVMSVLAGNARPTDTGVRRGVDVNVTVVLGDRTIEGEVTLLPAVDGRPRYEAWEAGPDNWVSGGLLGELHALSDVKFGEALDEIEAAASEVAGSPVQS
jgi:hypothetical protein